MFDTNMLANQQPAPPSPSSSQNSDGTAYDGVLINYTNHLIQSTKAQNASVLDLMKSMEAKTALEMEASRRRVLLMEKELQACKATIASQQTSIRYMNKRLASIEENHSMLVQSVVARWKVDAAFAKGSQPPPLGVATNPDPDIPLPLH